MSRTKVWGVRINTHGASGYKLMKGMANGEWWPIGYYDNWHDAVSELERWQEIEKTALANEALRGKASQAS